MRIDRTIEKVHPPFRASTRDAIALKQARAEVERPRISLWLVQRDRLYREALVYGLNQTDGLHCDRVFPTFETLKGLLEEPISARPDVLVLDISQPGRDGTKEAQYLTSRLPQVPVIWLTVQVPALNQIVCAIKVAHRGGILVSAPSAAEGQRLNRQPRRVADYGLTAREVEVLKLISEGNRQREIAERLSISPHTVNSHISNIYGKMKVRSAAEAVARGIREGLL